MHFGLKNAGTTYQWAKNTIFRDLIGKIVEVYINDVVVKSNRCLTHLMNQDKLKRNPTKCAFGVFAGNFFSFLAHLGR